MEMFRYQNRVCLRFGLSRSETAWCFSHFGEGNASGLHDAKGFSSTVIPSVFL